jgi:hypothetical protein
VLDFDGSGTVEDVREPPATLLLSREHSTLAVTRSAPAVDETEVRD